MTDLGTFVEHDGRPAVRFERTYPHTVERVWAAVTSPDELQRWFPSTMRFDASVGGTVHFSGDPHAGDATGVVLAFDPPRRFSFTWLTDELHFTLAPVGQNHCRLVLVNVLADPSAAARNASGWHVCLAELAKHLDGRPSAGPHSDDTQPWQPIYDAYLRAGLPSGAEIPGSVGG
jgi:uncharacterized protein YndB with AHSA1/START domain